MPPKGKGIDSADLRSRRADDLNTPNPLPKYRAKKGQNPHPMGSPEWIAAGGFKTNPTPSEAYSSLSWSKIGHQQLYNRADDPQISAGASTPNNRVAAP